MDTDALVSALTALAEKASQSRDRLGKLTDALSALHAELAEIIEQNQPDAEQ